MSQTSEAQPTLEGEWAKEALRAVDIPWLMDIANGQAEQQIREGQKARWERAAVVLGLGEEGDSQLLQKVQQYYARTHPKQRCPCRKWKQMNSRDDHFPNCEFERATIMKEKVYEQLEAKVKELQREKENVEHWWHEEDQAARAFENRLRASFFTHLSSDGIKKTVELGLRELDMRFEEMPPPPPKRTRRANDDDEYDLELE